MSEVRTRADEECERLYECANALRELPGVVDVHVNSKALRWLEVMVTGTAAGPQALEEIAAAGLSITNVDTRHGDENHLTVVNVAAVRER